jgi:hypothetical protein
MSLVAVGSLDADTEMEMESWFGPGWRSDCLAMQQATAECNGLGISSVVGFGYDAVHELGYLSDVGSGRRIIKIEINHIWVLRLG